MEYRVTACMHLQERDVNRVDVAAGRTVCGAAVEVDPGLRRTLQVIPTPLILIQFHAYDGTCNVHVTLCYTTWIQIVLRPHSLTRRNGLVNQVKFLGACAHFCDLAISLVLTTFGE